MRLRNFLDFESKSLTRQERLSLILHAAFQARDRARSEIEWQELDFVCHDCGAALKSLDLAPSVDDPWIDRRIVRMIRILNHYEGRFIRLNRRLWWLFLAVGIVLLLLAVLFGSPPDNSVIEASQSLL